MEEKADYEELQRVTGVDFIALRQKYANKRSTASSSDASDGVDAKKQQDYGTFTVSCGFTWRFQVWFQLL